MHMKPHDILNDLKGVSNIVEIAYGGWLDEDIKYAWQRYNLHDELPPNDVDGLVSKLFDLSMSKEICGVSVSDFGVLLWVEDCKANTSNISINVIKRLLKLAA